VRAGGSSDALVRQPQMIDLDFLTTHLDTVFDVDSPPECSKRYLGLYDDPLCSEVRL